MEDIQKQSCRLCLNLINSKNFTVIDGVVKGILDAVHFELNLDEDISQVVCNSCSEKLHAACEFKAECLSNNDAIVLYADLENLAPVDLKEMYVKEMGIGTLFDQEICRLCIQPVEKIFVSVNEVQPDIFQNYIPEVNLKVTEYPVICNTCVDSLISHSSFLKNCSNVVTNSKQVVNQVVNLCTKTEKFHEEKGNETIFKSEINYDTMEVANEEVPIKIEKNELENWENVEEESLSSSIHLKTISETPESFFNTNMFDCDIEIAKTEVDSTTCNNRASEISKCEFCNFETDHLSTLKDHISFHGNPKKQLYQCDVCHHFSKTKDNLKQHMITHKDKSEIQWHACSVCNYKSKYKHGLYSHMMMHRNSSEIQWHECDVCDRKFKFRYILNRHKLLHQDPSQMQCYECDICSFKVNRKDNLSAHMLIHKNDSEIQWYECDVCNYKSKYKRILTMHKLIHKDASEVQWYKCEVCDFKSKHKKYLKQHVLIHKDDSEIVWHKCEICNFKSKRKCNLKQHMLTHKNICKIRWHVCGLCEYKSKHKSHLTRHMLTHK